MDGYIDNSMLEELSKTSPELKHLSNITSELKDVRAVAEIIDDRLINTNRQLEDLNSLTAYNNEQLKHLVHLKDILGILILILSSIIVFMFYFIFFGN